MNNLKSFLKLIVNHYIANYILVLSIIESKKYLNIIFLSLIIIENQSK